MGNKYTLNVKNDSGEAWDFCVYQTNPEQDNNVSELHVSVAKNIYSLAWFSKAANPQTHLQFDWYTNFFLTWSDTGVLKPGIKFEASEMKPVTLGDTTENSTLLTIKNDAYTFADTYQAPVDRFTIEVDSVVPNNRVAIGVGMNGKAALATNALTGISFDFIPHISYWIVAGSFKEGEVIDLNAHSNAYKIVYADNVFEKDIRLTSVHEWKEG